MSDIINADAAAIIQVEIDSQIATAKQYPRDIKACGEELHAMVTMDLDTAESCTYSLPRDGKAITGPSVRFAEMAANSWGNIRFGWRVLAIEEKFVECQGVCRDLQKNVETTISAKRSIWSTRGNKRYSENMIQTTIQACGAIALRNSILKCVPQAFTKKAMDAAQHFVLEQIGDYKEKIPQLVDAFARLDVPAQKLCKYFMLETIEDMSAGNFLTCKGIYNAIRGGESVAGDYFGTPKRESARAPDQQFTVPEGTE